MEPVVPQQAAHELYGILASRLFLHGEKTAFASLTNSFTALLREFGERYQVRELYRAIVYVCLTTTSSLFLSLPRVLIRGFYGGM